MAEDKKTTDADSAAEQPQPGAVITPGAAQTPAPEQPQPAEPEARLEPKATPPAPDDPKPIASTGDGKGQKVTWTASEFVAHAKSAGWYTLLIAGTMLLAVIVFFVTRDFISVGVIVVAGLLLGVYGAHQPRQLEYVVDRRGIGIGQKHYNYDEFKSFSVVPEGAFSSLVFMPLGRFAIPTTIYYAPDDEERILNILTDHLPLEEHRGDAVDNLMRRIRF